MEFHLDFKKDRITVMRDAETAGFPCILAKTLFDAAPDGTRCIDLHCRRIGKNLYTGQVQICNPQGVSFGKTMNNTISPTLPVLELAQLALDLVAPAAEAEEQGTPA